MLTIGLVINPYAGIGGPMALKGSDGVDREALLAKGGQCLAQDRASVVLQGLADYQDKLAWFSGPSIMGTDALSACGYASKLVGEIDSHSTTGEDSERIVAAMAELGLDIILFIGGDGTARNVVNALAEDYPKQLVLGIPAGVKMHSGVYTVSPQAALPIIMALADKEAVSADYQEVRDIDEQALREGKLNSRYYGELWVPNDDRYVQQVKNTGRMNEEAYQLEIAASIVDDMEDDTLYLVGCGTTPKAIMDELGLPNTLLGVDVVLGRELIACDVTGVELTRLINEQFPHHRVVILVTAIGGQGHIIGRGNQQLTSQILRHTGRSNLQVLMTPSKLAELEHRPLLMDSGDCELDEQWSGLIDVHTGYQQRVVYPLNRH